jgi:hypothetical protein
MFEDVSNVYIYNNTQKTIDRETTRIYTSPHGVDSFEISIQQQMLDMWT